MPCIRPSSVPNEQNYMDRIPPLVNHLSLVFKNTLHLPKEVEALLETDTEYYVVNALKADLLISPEFVQVFLSHGYLQLFTENKLDVNLFIIGNTMTLTGPKERLEALGLEFKVHRGIKDSLARIDIDLIEQCGERKGLERLRNSLKERLGPVGRASLFWTPTDPSVCPSSVAKFFHDHGSVVEEKPLESRNVRLNHLPAIYRQEDLWDAEDWLGAGLLGDIEGVAEVHEVENVLIKEYKGLVSRSLLNTLTTLRDKSQNLELMTLSSPIMPGKVTKKMSEVLIKRRTTLAWKNNQVLTLETMLPE